MNLLGIGSYGDLSRLSVGIFSRFSLGPFGGLSGFSHGSILLEFS